MDEKPSVNGIKKEERDEKGRFVDGWRGGPGHPPGQLNFNTIFEKAIKKIIEEQKFNIDDPEREMVVKAVIEALKGNYAYFRDLMDRKYGKALERTESDITSGGEKIDNITRIELVNHEPKSK